MRRVTLQIIARRSALAGGGFACRVRGAVLLIAIFAMLIVSSLVVLLLNMATTEMAITRNQIGLNKVLYVADAGIQHALAIIRQDPTWRAGIPTPGVEFPPGSSGSGYIVNVAEGVEDEIIITATGTVGGLSKTLRATVFGVH